MNIPAKLPPAPKATPPKKPTNVLHDVSTGISKVVGLPSMGVNLLNEGFAKLTDGISKALPSFPAATRYSIAGGFPHAHTLHPPFIAIPPVGPVLLGNCVSVKINGKAAARCGDLGVAPTCCGLPPIFEIFTGSSKVFIGGGRAARVLDITYHCKFVPPAGAAARGAAAAAQAAMKAAMIAGFVAQGLAIAGDAVESAKAEDPAMAEALAMSAGTAAKQMAEDVAALAAGALMGKDLCVPPGTPGAITTGSTDVLIGGFPMPSWMNIAKGLLKLIKGLRNRGKGKPSGQKDSG